MDLTPLYQWLGQLIPLDCMKVRFMQQALLGMILMGPICGALGVHVVSFRMAFFSDAISHSAFTGVALGFLLGTHPHWSMLLFGVLIGWLIMSLGRRGQVSMDTVIGVVFSGTVAFGLAMISRNPSSGGLWQRFLTGDILAIQDSQILLIAGLMMIMVVVETLGFNQLLQIGIQPTLAEIHGIPVRLILYGLSTYLSLVVMVAVSAVGVFLVTALLIVPAAAARNLGRSAVGTMGWSIAISSFSCVSGLLISAQPWAGTASGATMVLMAVGIYCLSLLPSGWRQQRAR